MQSNQNIKDTDINIIDDSVWDNLYNEVKQGTKLTNLSLFINETSSKYNIDKKNIIKDFLNYIIKTHPKYVNNKFLDFVENLMHSQNQNSNIQINYLIANLSSSLST